MGIMALNIVTVREVKDGNQSVFK